MKYKSKKIEKRNKYIKKSRKKPIKKSNSKFNKLKKMVFYGGDEANMEIWNSFSNDEKNSLINEANPTNNDKLKNSIEDVKNLYKDKYGTKQLYDFIFSKNDLKIIKIWDHKVNDPNSITGGLEGIHLYTIYENGKYQVIAKFIRNSS